MINPITNRPRTNTSKLFANAMIQSNPSNIFNNDFNKDLQTLLNGNCIYIENFFTNNSKDLSLFNYIKSDIETKNVELLNFRNHNDALLMMHEKENRNISITFTMIINKMAEYFDIEIKNALLNLYKDGNDYKPFHSDKYSEGVDITIGASFGFKRDLHFLHKKTKQRFSITQRNGDIFAFTKKVNDTFKHSIPKQLNKECGPRFSVIVWGKQRNPI